MRRLQDEMTAQGALQETQLQELAAENEALRELLEAQSAIQSEKDLDTQGGNARVHRDMQDSLSVLTQLVAQILRSQVTLSERIEADGARGTSTDPASPGALVRRDGGDPAACDQIWEAAITQFNRGSNAAARRGFNGFLAGCPDDERAPRARFSLGDIAAQQDRPDDAIEEFLRIVQLHPLADQVPMAQYRIGLIYVEQGNVEEARTHLEIVVNSYPDSGVAELAQAELQEIR